MALAHAPTGSDAFPLPIDTPPMEARLVDALPSGAGWQFEPKWDGFRCLAFRTGAAVDVRAKSGKPLGRYFPDVVAGLAALPQERFVVDGELAIPTGATLSFDALQLRLHPAESRVRKLAAASPALFILFDLLADGDGRSFLDAPLRQRRTALETFVDAAGGNTLLRLSPYTRERAQAQRWLNKAGGAVDGVVAKQVDGLYETGQRAMLKVKKMRTADCVVGGFRYGQGETTVGSLLLGLYNDDGRLDHVGFTSNIPRADRPSLTKRLEALVEPPGFTGSKPGGPSRWSTERSDEWQPLRPELVVEVRYDHAGEDRFRHGASFLRWRPDKAPEQCRFDQLQREVRPSRLIDAILEA